MSKRKKSKGFKHDRHSKPHETRGEHYVPNDASSRGPIEVSRSPSLKEEHDAERKHDQAQDKKRFVIEVVTLVFVIVVAGLTGLQDYFTHRYVTISQDTFDASIRPYVGVSGIAVSFNKKRADGQEITVNRPDSDTHWMNFTAEIKDFGPVPGTEYYGGWRVFIGGIEQKGDKIPDKPTTIFPNDIMSLTGQIGSKDYPDVMSGSKVLMIEISVSYNGPAAHYKQCSKHQFLPDIARFADLGPC